MMDVRPVRTEDDYDWALAELARYFEREPEPGSPEADRFDVLSELVAAYENRHYPVPEVDPVDVIRAVMAERGFVQADLAELFGSRSRASEVLGRKRPLTIEMIRALATAWSIPADLIIRPYPLAA
jgi:HTH-type transcriptional regulator/antitoxin HigA